MDTNKLNSGELYDCIGKELIAYQHELVQKLNDFNRTSDTPEGLEERKRILKEIVGTYGEGLYILPPVSANFGLHNVHFGRNITINFNVSFVDDGSIYIGDETMIGPNVSIITAQHPVSPGLRAYSLDRKSTRLNSSHNA